MAPRMRSAWRLGMRTHRRWSKQSPERSGVGANVMGATWGHDIMVRDAIPGGPRLQLLRKGVVVNVQNVDLSQSEWDKWQPTSPPNAGKVMKGQMTALTQRKPVGGTGMA